MEPVYFSNSNELRIWFEKNHDRKDELQLGYYKKSTGILSVTWEESVEQALCFGWIDSIRNSIDERRYTIRFTPRRKGSNWSKKNIETVLRLQKKGLLKPEGLKAFEQRSKNKLDIYSSENKLQDFSDEIKQVFIKNKKAWIFFKDQPPSYKKTTTQWVMSAKREETRDKRLNELISDSENGLRIKALRRN